MDTSDLITRACAGDDEAFRELVDAHTRELQVHCYRILGSLQDAEDALQETLMSAWRNLEGFRQRSSLRLWLYQIATNRCLSMLRAESRRPRTAVPMNDALPEPTGTSEIPAWLQPYPDVLLNDLADRNPGPEARYETTEAISLAFIVALQLLPPRQRAVLVLRDVLGYPALEVAQMLDTTHDGVRSALKRARATVDSYLAESRGAATAQPPNTATEQRIVAQLTDAFARGDVHALIALLTDDVRLSMPPAMLEYQGVDSARRFFSSVTFRPGRTYRLVPTRANRQPAFGVYTQDPHTRAWRAYGLLVVTISGERITAVTGFDIGLLAPLGLPRTLHEDLE